MTAGEQARADVLVSLIVPVRDDGEALTALLSGIPPDREVEVIVAATGRRDERLAALQRQRPDVTWLDGLPGRGVQLNHGAGHSCGRWLWFVHADSRLPSDWLEVFRCLDRRPGIVGGAFVFRLDSSAWQARWLERAVACRVRLFDLPYGDQGIFVRRPAYDALEGFRPLPLMEDVDFVRRLKHQGPLAYPRAALVTSARRWERRGWLRQSMSNLLTLALYALGVPPERLARRYER